jgi:hypothetical protein
MGIEGDLIV